jgi:hypothetical protein
MARLFVEGVMSAKQLFEQCRTRFRKDFDSYYAALAHLYTHFQSELGNKDASFCEREIVRAALRSHCRVLYASAADLLKSAAFRERLLEPLREQKIRTVDQYIT